jgi:hypothetical protein
MNERTENPMSLSLRHLILSLILLFSTGVLRAQCEGKSGIALIVCNGAQRIPGGAAAGPLAPFVQYLLDEQPVTTSFHNTRPADPTARYLAPANYAPLSTLPRTADGAFLLRPGAYEGYLQSYCLKAGTYGPSQGDGYLAAPLTGPKAAIVRTILKQAPRHPEVRQQDIQQLLWAVIAKVDYRQMPQEMHRTAAALLPPRELEQLRGGIISRLPDAFRQPLEQHIQRRLAVVQGPLRQVLHAENNLRTQIATRASFDVMARTAVLAGAAPADPSMPPVPRGAWIQNRQGFYLRYLPDSYSRTKVQLVVPESTPTTTADPLIFDPTEELAVPANTAGQRLGLTARDQDGQPVPESLSDPRCISRFESMKREANTLNQLADTLARNNQAYRETGVELILQGFNSPLAALILDSEDDIANMFSDAAAARRSRNAVVQAIRDKAAIRSLIATVGSTRDYSNSGITSESSIEYFCTLNPEKMSYESWEGLRRAGYIDQELYQSTLRTMWLRDAAEFVSYASGLINPGLWAAKSTLPKLGAVALRGTQVGAVKTMARGAAPAIAERATYLARFGADDLVYGPGANGALRAFQKERGGLLFQDVVKEHLGETVTQASVRLLQSAARSKRQVHWDLTNMDDIANVLARKGPMAEKITSHEFRFIRENWDEFLVKPKFYRNGIEVGRPW